VATVTAPKVIACDTSFTSYASCGVQTRRIGEDLQYGFYVYLEAAPAGAVTITATSASPAAATISAVETVAGGATASVANVTAGGANNGVRFWMSGLTQGADTQVTFTAPGYESVTVPVSIDPSGFVQSTAAISTNSSAANTTLQVYAARLTRGTYAYGERQEPRAGVTASVEVTSSDLNVGTITVSPLTAQTIGDNNDDNWLMTTAFDPVGGGTATLRVIPPAGWDTPVAAFGFGPERVATVTLPRISVNGSYSPSIVRVGEDLQVRVTAALEVAPGSPLTLTATSSNGAIVTITDVENQTGSASDSVSVDSLAFRNLWIQGLQSGATESVTFSAPGYESTTLGVAVDPSGFVTTTADFSISASSADRAIVIYAVRLNSSTLAYQESQEVRGGLVVSVEITSSDPGVGTISDSPIFVQSIADGNVSEAGRTLFDPIAAGQSVIEIVPPLGWHQPANGGTDRLVVVTVTP
jgi:plastocyanin